MPIYRVERRFPQRQFSRYPTFLLRMNESVFAPWRMGAWMCHLIGLICIADSKDRLIIQSSLPIVFSNEDYLFLHTCTDMALAASIVCLAFCMWGICTTRTLRSGALNVIHGTCHTAAAVLLVVSWYCVAHIARLWHVFYIFSIIPTGVEFLALSYSYRSGIHTFR